MSYKRKQPSEFTIFLFSKISSTKIMEEILELIASTENMELTSKKMLKAMKVTPDKTDEGYLRAAKSVTEKMKMYENP